MATSSPNLYKKLLLITEEIGKIDKTGSNSAQGYRFIEQAQVVAEVRVQLAKHGVVIIPETVSRTIDRYVVTKPGYKQGDPPKEQASYHVNVVSRYTIINADNPEERITCEWDAGEALDTSDKATNKAVTASDKYFLMKLFKISDRDDPDASSQEAHVEPPKAATKPTAPREVVKVQTPPEKPVGTGLIHPGLMTELRQKLRDAGMTGDNATAFVESRIQKPAPTTNDEAQSVIDGLNILLDEVPEVQLN